MTLRVSVTRARLAMVGTWKWAVGRKGRRCSKKIENTTHQEATGKQQLERNIFAYMQTHGRRGALKFATSTLHFKTE